MGRIKEISRKSAHTRKRNPVVYLICEGSETEIRYFKRFRSRGCNIDIIPISSQYKSADRLVQKAKATMGNNKGQIIHKAHRLDIRSSLWAFHLPCNDIKPSDF